MDKEGKERGKWTERWDREGGRDYGVVRRKGGVGFIRERGSERGREDGKGC